MTSNVILLYQLKKFNEIKSSIITLYGVTMMCYLLGIHFTNGINGTGFLKLLENANIDKIVMPFVNWMDPILAKFGIPSSIEA